MRITTALLLLALWTSAHAQDDPIAACLKKLPSNPKLTPIVTKVAVSAYTDTSFPMLADQSRPNEAERKAIADWAAERNECVKGGDAYWREHYPPQIYAIGMESESTLMALAVELYNGKLTFGEFNKRRRAAADESLSKMAAVLQQLKSEQEARQEARRQFDTQAEQSRQATQAQQDIARRQAAMQFLVNKMQLEQPKPFVPLSPQRPSYNTDCYQVGNQLNCTTR